jgi:transposase
MALVKLTKPPAPSIRDAACNGWGHGCAAFAAGRDQVADLAGRLDLAGAADLGVSASRQVIEVPLAAAGMVQYDSHSDGFVHSLLARAAMAVRHVNMLIRVLTVTAGVISADETPIRVGPGPKSRSMASFGGFVFPDLSGSVTVHDRYQNYDAFTTVWHQLCCAHVLRDLEDCAESYPDAIWPGQAADALRALIHAANTARAQGLAAVPDDTITVDLRLFRAAVLVGLQEVRRVPGAEARQKPGRTLLECLHDREDDILRFLTDLRIPPTSNQAERDLRWAKTQEKISGRLRSETATRNRYAIRGYASTAIKHGRDALTAIRDALAGNPWMPPIPEAA